MNKIIWWLSWNQADGEKNSIHLIRKCACSKKRTNTHTQAIKKEENSREDHNKGRNSLTYHWLRMSPVPQRTTVGSKYQTSTIYPFLFISYNYVQTDCTVKHTQFPSNSMNSSHLHLKTSLDIVTHISRLSGCQPTCAVYICLWSIRPPSPRSSSSFARFCPLLTLVWRTCLLPTTSGAGFLWPQGQDWLWLGSSTRLLI